MKGEEHGPSTGAEQLRVLHFAETLRGGLATYLNELLPLQLKAYGHVAVLCPEDQRYLIERDGVHVIGFPRPSRSLVSMLKLWRCWIRHLRTNSYDVVHLHSSFAGAIGRATKQNARVVYCSHGWSHAMSVGFVKRKVFSVVERILSRRASVIVNISKSESDYAAAAGIAAKRCVLIHNGIGDREWSALPPGRLARKLLFVGRFDRQKGIDLLVEAMAILRGEGYELEVIGGPVIGKASVTTFPSHIRNLGWKSAWEVQQAIDRADVIVVPSRWEGFGLVAAEAMRAGRPVLASRVGGLPELVADGETGILFEPNSVESIAAGIRQIGSMDASVLGRNGRARYEREFSIERLFARLHAVYLPGITIESSK